FSPSSSSISHGRFWCCLESKSSALCRGSLRRTRSTFLTSHSRIAGRARLLVSGRRTCLPGHLAHARLAGTRNRGGRGVFTLAPRSGGASPRLPAVSRLDKGRA